MRVAAAIAVIAIAFSAAVYIHERHTAVVGIGTPTYEPGAARGHPSWEDPIAVLIAIGGIAVAVGIVAFPNLRVAVQPPGGRAVRTLAVRASIVVVVIAAAVTVISTGVFTQKGATAKEALGAELLADVPNWVKAEKLPPQAVPGAKLFATSGCLNCHTYLGVGGALLGAPNLSAEGSKNKGITFQIQHLKCPSCVNKGSPMPSFAAFSNANLRQLAIFIEASNGPN